MEEHDSIDLRSKAFQEVLGEPPSWLLRWGISAILLAFIALFVVGYFLEYPETVTASIRLETTNPPIELGAPALGNITYFLPEDTLVKKDDVLARISDGIGNFDDILALNNAIGSFTIDSKVLPNLTPFQNTNIGLIEPDLLQYIQMYQGNGVSPNALKTQSIDNFNRNVQTINSEIAVLENRITDKEKAIGDIPKRIKSLQDAFLKKNSKTKDKIVRDSLNIGYQTIVTQLRSEKELLEGEIIGLNNDIDQKRREIKDREIAKSNYQTSIQGNQVTRKQSIALSFSILKNRLQEWSAKHIIRAPESGTLVHQGKLKSKEYLVDVGDKIFAIIPPGAEESIEGKLYLSSQESVKIKVGQPVKIKFNAFRPSEYGLLSGEVIDKATIPKNGQYLITVSLSDRMKTSKDKLIPFEHQMQGEAEIITEDRRFTDLIFDQFKEMLRR